MLPAPGDAAVTLPDRPLEPSFASADFSRFLSACFYEPTPMFAEERLFESMGQAARLVAPELAQPVLRLGEAYAAEDPQGLRVDYGRLFLGPVDPRARPYGSFWLTGDATAMHDATLALLDLYRAGGFEMADDFRDLPDHVAVELEFLYVLTFRLVQAGWAGDRAGAAALTALRDRFLDEQLGAWIEPFTEAMRNGAETAFYRELADLTRRWVRVGPSAAATP